MQKKKHIYLSSYNAEENSEHGKEKWTSTLPQARHEIDDQNKE